MKHSYLYIKIAAMLAAVALLGGGMTMLLRPERSNRTGDLQIVTSFYPMYIAACNVVGDTQGVEVANLIESAAGCVHDYAMSPEDKQVLADADVFVMNGAGAEAVLEDALSALPSLRVVDLSVGQTLLDSDHVHDHDHAHEDSAFAHEANSHLWVSPLRHRQQIETLRDALCEVDPVHMSQYTANAAAYIARIDAVWQRMKTATVPFADMPTVVFHDSLAYLAEDLDLHVTAALNIGEDAAADPDTLVEATKALTDVPTALFLYDSQYSSEQYQVLNAAPQRVIAVSADTCVAGDTHPDRWLEAMTALCEQWEAAAE